MAGNLVVFIWLKISYRSGATTTWSYKVYTRFAYTALQRQLLVWCQQYGSIESTHHHHFMSSEHVSTFILRACISSHVNKRITFWAFLKSTPPAWILYLDSFLPFLQFNGKFVITHLCYTDRVRQLVRPVAIWTYLVLSFSLLNFDTRNARDILANFVALFVKNGRSSTFCIPLDHYNTGW